jgi:hypothetical protein
MFALRKHRTAGLLSLVPILILVFNEPLEKGLTHILRKMEEPETTLLAPEAPLSAETAVPFSGNRGAFQRRMKRVRPTCALHDHN